MKLVQSFLIWLQADFKNKGREQSHPLPKYHKNGLSSAARSSPKPLEQSFCSIRLFSGLLPTRLLLVKPHNCLPSPKSQSFPRFSQNQHGKVYHTNSPTISGALQSPWQKNITKTAYWKIKLSLGAHSCRAHNYYLSEHGGSQQAWCWGWRRELTPSPHPYGRE